MRVLLVGTGTDVGKTHVTCALGAYAPRSVAAYKPIATGCDRRCEDAERHAEALGAPYVPPTFGYRRPISPHLAARDEGRPIELAPIVTCAASLEREVEVLLVESAGGLFSPLDDTRTVADLARELAPDVLLLVAPDRIGVLHDVRATLLAARGTSLPKPLLVLSAPPEPDASTGCNAAELERLGLGPVLAVFPRAPIRDETTADAARRVWVGLGVGTPNP